jgi:hypothetical protein
MLAPAAFSAGNEHPAFKLKSGQELKNLKPTSRSHTSLSRLKKHPSFDELHYEEKHPHKDAILVDTSSIDPSKLNSSRMISMDPNKPSLNLPDPQITIGGENYILSIVESVPDITKMVRYVTAKIVGHTGQVRFIIDDASGEVVGNFLIDGISYRLIPRDTKKDQQLIFKLKHEASSGKVRSKNIILSKKESSTVYRLEKELLKTELIQEIRPKYYSENHKFNGKRIDVIGGNVGKLDIKKLFAKDHSIISNLLSELKLATTSDDSYQYTIGNIRGNDKNGYSVRFRQVINGIPLQDTSLVKIDPDGKIKHLSSLVLNPDSNGIKHVKFNQTEALEIAKKATIEFRKNVDIKLISLKSMPPELTYKLVGDDYGLTPHWIIYLYEIEPAKGSAYTVSVDGFTGLANVHSSGIPVTDQFKTEVCQPDAGMQLPICQDIIISYPFYLYHTVVDIISESDFGEFICELSSLCQDPQAKHPWEVINNMEDWLSESTDGVCCDSVGGLSDTVDVMINSQDPQDLGPVYYPGQDTIVFPHPSELNPTKYNPVQAQKIDDVVVHEATHSVSKSVNGELITAATTDDDALAAAMVEGFSDAMAVLYSEKFSPPGDTKVAEELFKNPNDVRDISDPKTLDDFVDSSDPGIQHQNGKIFGNMIYRSRQAGLSIDQAAKATILILEQVNRDGGLVGDKFDQKDIKEALERISILDQVIGAILETVWSDMNGYEDPPTGGGGSNPPYSPSYVTGFFTGCTGTVSIYLDSWGSSTGASYYNMYYSTTGGSYTYFGSSSFPSSTVYNTVNGYVKISACNSYGCSALSNNAFFQPHICGG